MARHREPRCESAVNSSGSPRACKCLADHTSLFVLDADGYQALSLAITPTADQHVAAKLTARPVRPIQPRVDSSDTPANEIENFWKHRTPGSR